MRESAKVLWENHNLGPWFSFFNINAKKPLHTSKLTPIFGINCLNLETSYKTAVVESQQKCFKQELLFFWEDNIPKQPCDLWIHSMEDWSYTQWMSSSVQYIQFSKHWLNLGLIILHFCFIILQGLSGYLFIHCL